MSVSLVDAVDLFAGPGGWDVAARELGLHVLGIEIDAAACATRRAAGLSTYEGDIRHYDPQEFPEARGLIASPPCQTFSAAGKGAGRLALDTVLLELKKVANGEAIDYGVYTDERTGLVLEPLRWIRDALAFGGYDWIALEQVPAVLPVWEAYAEVLRDWGYSVATGKLSAEQYGVPQTRKRAILVAKRRTVCGHCDAGLPMGCACAAEASLPAPTHTAYAKGKSRFTGAEDGLIPWVSMAEALGWGMTARPYPTIACSRSTGGPDKEKVGGSGGRAEIYGELEAGRWAPGGDVWMVGAGAGGAGRPRPSDEPAPTIAGGGAAAWIDDPEKWYGQDSTNPGPGESYAEGADVTYVNGTHEKAGVRVADEPAPTVMFGARLNSVDWVVSTGANQHLIGPEQREGTDWREHVKGYERPIDAPAPTVDGKAGSAWKVHPAGERPAPGDVQLCPTNLRPNSTLRDLDEPAATLAFGHERPQWVAERPATTVQGDPRIGQPGHKCMTEDCHPGRGKTLQFGKWSVRVTLEEAAVLQSFPRDYPWQGTKTKQFQQIGNAVPPLLARAVLVAVTR